MLIINYKIHLYFLCFFTLDAYTENSDKIGKINLSHNINFEKNYFLDEKELNTINRIYMNKYFLRKILYEFTPFIILSFFYLNNGSIIILSVLQLFLSQNTLNLITCGIFALIFNLQREKSYILHIYGAYLLILFIIEFLCIYNYTPINLGFLSFIGLVFSGIIISRTYEDFFNKKDFIILMTFLIASTSILPFNIKNTLDRIKKNEEYENTHNNSYGFM